MAGSSPSNPADAIPVRLSDGTSFYVAGAGGGSPDGATPLGYTQVTLTGVGTLVVPAGAAMAVITADTAAARWRDDGVAPTATVGMPLAVGVPTTFSGDLAVLKFISQTGVSVLNVSFYG